MLRNRLAYAARWSVVAVLPLFAMLVAVGNARFLSEAIDPTLGKESQSMVVDGRVADNTLQQFVCFLVGITALSVSVPIGWISVIPGVAITFVVAGSSSGRLPHPPAVPRAGLLLDRLHEPVHVHCGVLAAADPGRR